MTNSNTNHQPTCEHGAGTKSVCKCSQAMLDLELWIENQLDELLENNPDWRTPNSNRRHFGR